MWRWIWGERSGFYTARDLILFVFGAGGIIYELALSGARAQVTTLLFFAGFMVSPYVLSRDEAKSPRPAANPARPPTLPPLGGDGRNLPRGRHAKN